MQVDEPDQPNAAAEQNQLEQAPAPQPPAEVYGLQPAAEAPAAAPNPLLPAAAVAAEAHNPAAEAPAEAAVELNPPVALNAAVPAVSAAAASPKLRSTHTRLPSLVSFRNCTERLVDVYWVNYQGECVLYKILEPGLWFHVNTFVSHPWVFRDHVTRAKLVINNSDVFMPKHFVNLIPPGNAGAVKPNRVTYDITIPIYTLKERAIQILLDKVGTEEQIRQLQLPGTLLHELLQAASTRLKPIVAP